jgi:hypothetical protein
VPRESGDDHAIDRFIEKHTSVGSAAQAERLAARRTIGRRGEVGQLVIFEMSERDPQVSAEATAGRLVETGRGLCDLEPTKPRMADLVGVDLGQETAQGAVGHFQTVRSDERDSDRFAEAADAEEVAQHAFGWTRVAVEGELTRLGGRCDGRTAQRLDHRAAQHAVFFFFFRKPPARSHGAAIVTCFSHLVGERGEYVRRHVFVDHADRPGADRRGYEARRHIQGGPTRSGCVAEIELYEPRHHASPSGISGGVGGPQGPQKDARLGGRMGQQTKLTTS